MTGNRTALYVLVAALALAALTNRWVAASGSRPAFNIVRFDGLYFAAQWLAFAMTLGALALLLADWRETGRFPLPVLLAGALLGFFVATGIPQTRSSTQWIAGHVGLKQWMRAYEQSKEADQVAPELVGTWGSVEARYRIEAQKLTITAGGKTHEWSKQSCPDGATFQFGYATEDTIGFHPSAYKLHDLLSGAPIPSLYARCDTAVFAFLRLPDGRLLTLRNPHQQDLQISYLTRAT